MSDSSLVQQPGESSLSIGQCAAWATILEDTAPKPGNVHRGADFATLTYLDFVLAATAIVPAIDRAAAGGRLGPCLLEAARRTRQLVATNTNLGTLLLVAPLAMVPRHEPLAEGVARVLSDLDADDATLVYEAIRTARPGGMGEVPEADLAGPPPADLIAAMRLAADRDLVARQYAHGFREVLGVVVPMLVEGLVRDWPLAAVIVHAQLRLLADYPDSLIARKAGPDVAQHASALATQVLVAGLPGERDYEQALADFDFWCRSDEQRRNPGATADLLAAGLFVLLRDGQLTPPLRFYHCAEPVR